MPRRRSSPTFGWLACAALIAAVAIACGGGDNGSSDNHTEGPTPTPFSLGDTLTIRGQEVVLPVGIRYFNQSPECQAEANVSSPECQNDLKMLARGDSYILFDAAQPRVIARRIESEDEGDFRPLLGLITGSTGGETPTLEPQPSAS